MQNIIVEFEIPGNNFTSNTHVCIINRDALREANKYPLEAKFAAAIDHAMASDEKSATVTREMFDAMYLKNPSFPCEVVDHICLLVRG